jgi:hypothetical protein
MPRLTPVFPDQFETPYTALSGTQKEVEDIIRRLARLRHVAVLVTMRGRYPSCDKAIKSQLKVIRPTDEAACIRIYRDIHSDSENDQNVGRLLHMPFAVKNQPIRPRKGSQRSR